MGAKRDVLLRETLAMSGSLVEVLEQRKYWKMQDGSLIKRKDMSLSHKFNVLAWLIRNAPDHINSYVNSSVFYTAPDDVWAELERMLSDPLDWTIKSAFFQALLGDVVQLWRAFEPLARAAFPDRFDVTWFEYPSGLST